MLLNFIYEYGLFLAKALTFVLAFALLLGLIMALKRSRHLDDEEGQLKITSLNEYYEGQREQLYQQTLNKKALKTYQKEQKKKEKEAEAQEDKAERKRLFVLDFDGDVQASAVEDLRVFISAIIEFAQAGDEVLLRLESGGGFVHAYGLAASQLSRLRAHNIRLVVAVDKVAASGGYMMACMADELHAAPFAIIGSIGVIGALPNFHELLKKNAIEYEEHTAGKYKRSLTMFGENTQEDREQFRRELLITHELFKAHIAKVRPHLDVEAVATGETWYGVQAVEKGLIDAVGMSDDFILNRLQTHQVLLLEQAVEESFLDKIKDRFLGKARLSSPFKTFIQ